MFDWLRHCWRRWSSKQQPLARAGMAARIPEGLWQQTLAELPFLQHLTAAERARLRELCARFLAEKEFTAAGGLVLHDALCLNIALQGCLPILNLDLSYYGDWVGIVVYPDEFVIPRQLTDADGLVHEYSEVASGEAWEGGPLLISWRDAQQAGSGYNVVIHEFAHKLDMCNGAVDGIPPLPAEITPQHWAKVLDQAWEDFCRRLEADAPSRIDPYAGESPVEFFAVLSEVFFETPAIVVEEYPDLYTLLVTFYRQDPLQRQIGAATALKPPRESPSPPGSGPHP